MSQNGSAGGLLSTTAPGKAHHYHYDPTVDEITSTTLLPLPQPYFSIQKAEK
jgi:hypothetical protein